MVKLDCEIYSPGKRAAATEKQREAIKNCELSSLDLLVREMIQNSLDAALDENREKAVSVYFRTGHFDVETFAECLGGTSSDQIYTRCLCDFVNKGGAPNCYLSIRDFGCVGLDGDVSDKKSRAWKLPFGFYDGQAADSITGGANGVGKVIAFRFGIGFVVYYSVTKDGHSRFVISFMDDGIHKVFPKKNMPNGAAWWGRKSTVQGLGVVCLENKADILELLEIFKIKPYGRGQSGTTTIIPFFDEAACMKEVRERLPVELCPWTQDLNSFLRFCINQWYAPRLREDFTVIDPEKIGNVTPYHWGRSLKIQLPIKSDDSAACKIFSLVRELYDVAVGEKEPTNGIKRITCPMRKSIPRKGIIFKGESLGWVAVKKINYKSGEYSGVLPVLCSLVPGNGDESVEDFSRRLGQRMGLMLYCRRHGMIVTYERDWDVCYSSLPKPQDGEFYVGIFVVNSDSTVTSPTIRFESSIDVIFRSFEKSDHYGWPRGASFCQLSIVSSLVSNIRKALADEFQCGNNFADREPLDRLSSLLGRFVSPSGVGYGDGPNPSPEGVGGVPGVGTGGRGGRGIRAGGGVPKGRVRFTQGAPIYKLTNHRTLVSIPVAIEFLTNVRRATIACGVVQDDNNKVLYASDFAEEISPVALIAAYVTGAKSPVSIALDKKNLTVLISAPRKINVDVMLQYVLNRRDVALYLDCKPEERGGAR